MARPSLVHPLPPPESAGPGAALPTSAQHPPRTGPNPAFADPDLPALSPQQEAFCAYYVDSGNGAQSAVRAGYRARSARHQASRLLTKRNIRAKIAALRADLGAENRIDRATLLAKLERAYHRALAEGRPLAAVRAVELQARLAGLIDGRGRTAPPAASAAADAEPKACTATGADADEGFPGARKPA
jgi:hypothetical protein